MKYPTTIVDNFFDNPDEIRDYAENCEWYRSDKIIGHRTEDLGMNPKHREFFHFLGHKIICLLHPYEPSVVSYRANLFFQKQIPGKAHLDGWIHKDNAEISCLMYLNKRDTYGTNVYKRKTQWASGVATLEGKPGENLKHKGFMNVENADFDEEQFLQLKEQHNSYFKPVTSVAGIYNRILLMDSCEYHALQTPTPEEDVDERLILMMWFYDIHMDGLKDGIIESRRFTI